MMVGEKKPAKAKTVAIDINYYDNYIQNRNEKLINEESIRPSLMPSKRQK